MTEAEITGLLFKLADLGVTGIKVKYDGGGDSGAIEWIGFTHKPCENSDDIDTHIEDWDSNFNLTNLDSDLYYEVENFAESKLLDDIEDWWNNEGGWGDLYMCIPSGKYEIINHIRITETEDYFHDGNILEKAENV